MWGGTRNSLQSYELLYSIAGSVPEVEMGELEGHGELIVQLVDNVKELKEERGETAVLTGIV